METDTSSFVQNKPTWFGSALHNKKPQKRSRKRRRPEYILSQMMSILPNNPVATASKTKMNYVVGPSWQLKLSALFLAISVVSSTTAGTPDLRRRDVHHQPTGASNEKHMVFEAIWDDFSDSGIKPLQKSSLALPHDNLEEDLTSKYDFPTKASSLRGHDNHQVNRSLRGTKRTKERFRKERDFDFHFTESVEERHRLLISCEVMQSQEDCISKFIRLYDMSSDDGNSIRSGHHHHVELIHNLKFAHALAVDVDAKTLGRMANDKEFLFEKDFVRGPLVVEGSMNIYQPSNQSKKRNLQGAQEVPWGLDAIRAQQVWHEYGIQGKGVKICVLDSGVQASHEDFRQSNFDGYYGKEFVSPYWYEDSKGHGTHIAGTIAASDNTIGIVGIAPEAETYIVRVFDDNRNFYEFADGTAYSTDLIAAATICKDWGADIINASLGGNTYNRIEEEFFKNLFDESGILTVAASGNGGDDRNVYPAAYEGVLSVGAVDEYMHMAEFSTWDPSTTDVLAPGVNILSTFKENLYATFSGTSMAAPHASGTLALMLSYIRDNKVNINRRDVFHALKLSTTPVDVSRVNENDASHRIGFVDAYAAIKYLESYAKETSDRVPMTLLTDSSTTHCENEAYLNIITDSNGGNIFYRLMSLSDNNIIWFKGPNKLENYATYSEQSCFEGPEDCYQFDIRDKGGDGIVNGGSIEIIYNGHKLYKGGNFGHGGVLKFGDCHD